MQKDLAVIGLYPTTLILQYELRRTAYSN